VGIDKLSLVVIGKDCTTTDNRSLDITPSRVVREDPLHDRRPDQERAEDSKEHGIGDGIILYIGLLKFESD
jgi:hypothetical protein